jgi:FKBP-type peptidyl-prolyl cis-trans isomerase FkpA
MTAQVKLAALAATGLLIAGCGSSDDSAAPAADQEPSVAAQADEQPALIIQTLYEGDGQMIMAGDTAVVHYTGWLHDENAVDNKGRQFDSSRGGRAIEFPLGDGMVIAGWETGIEGMLVGEQRRLVIPPHLAYGDRGAGGGVVPPGATLIFDVELIDIR